MISQLQTRGYHSNNDDSQFKTPQRLMIGIGLLCTVVLWITWGDLCIPLSPDNHENKSFVIENISKVENNSLKGVTDQLPISYCYRLFWWKSHHTTTVQYTTCVSMHSSFQWTHRMFEKGVAQWEGFSAFQNGDGHVSIAAKEAQPTVL